MAEGKKVKCTLKQNNNYGKAIRKGLKSEEEYTFEIGKETEVSADDMPGLTDPKSAQYTSHLQVVK